VPIPPGAGLGEAREETEQLREQIASRTAGGSRSTGEAPGAPWAPLFRLSNGAWGEAACRQETQPGHRGPGRILGMPGRLLCDPLPPRRRR
jgi:hypothetical protein